ncbi:MAG: glycosyltransferase [Hyperionvirus sp.]|uniref:Glycosyltransferase n=1 Tax=Hyperionvirus sp. TaxID=2487770 RepID=A0A3G5A8I7_9VIRU|nr:MAG: glycosyltransferase [Hyperionvirus sp.]
MGELSITDETKFWLYPMSQKIFGEYLKYLERDRGEEIKYIGSSQWSEVGDGDVIIIYVKIGKGVSAGFRCIAQVEGGDIYNVEGDLRIFNDQNLQNICWRLGMYYLFDSIGVGEIDYGGMKKASFVCKYAKGDNVFSCVKEGFAIMEQILGKIPEEVLEEPEVAEVQEIEEQIKRLLGVKKVYDRQLDAYFLDTKVGYQPVKLGVMFPDVGPYEYFKPIGMLAENFDGRYYKNILEKKISLGRERLDKIAFDTLIDIEDLDNVMLNFIKSRGGTFCISVWPIASGLIEKIAEELGNHGNVYYVKKIMLTYNGLRNLMFWMYDEFSFHERDMFIGKKLEYVKASRFGSNEVGLIVFDNVKGMSVAGQGSPFKKRLRRL